jgi:acyl-CoA thioesterase-1
MTTGDFVLQDGQTVVLIGDSITDCGRRDQHAPLGNGYVGMVDALAAAKYPGCRLHVVNSGVGGDTIRELAQRWDVDVLDYRPDWLSVSIGINDVWRQLDSDTGGVPVDEFAAVYRELLECTRGRLSGCGLILMTPGIIGEDPASEGNRRLQPYVEIVEKLAGKFNAFCVAVHAAFTAALASGAGRPWTEDGVHPNSTGHGLMALTWLRTLNW